MSSLPPHGNNASRRPMIKEIQNRRIDNETSEAT